MVYRISCCSSITWADRRGGPAKSAGTASWLCKLVRRPPTGDAARGAGIGRHGGWDPTAATEKASRTNGPHQAHATPAPNWKYPIHPHFLLFLLSTYSRMYTTSFLKCRYFQIFLSQIFEFLNFDCRLSKSYKDWQYKSDISLFMIKQTIATSNIKDKNI